jgi:hypothetical protein
MTVGARSRLWPQRANRVHATHDISSGHLITGIGEFGAGLRTSQDLQRLFQGSEIVVPDQDSRRSPVASHDDALMFAFRTVDKVR